MATIEIPSSAAPERDIPTGIAPASLEEVVRYGEGLGDEQYIQELQQLIGHDMLITTVSRQHVSPLEHSSRFLVRFKGGSVTFNQYPTTLHDVHRGELFFPYDHTFTAHSGETSTRTIQAVAPLNRAITTIYLAA